MHSILLFAAIAVCAIQAAPNPQNSNGGQDDSGGQMQRLQELIQAIQSGKIDLNQLPKDQDGNIDLGQIPGFSGGKITIQNIPGVGGSQSGQSGGTTGDQSGGTQVSQSGGTQGGQSGGTTGDQSGGGGSIQIGGSGNQDGSEGQGGNGGQGQSGGQNPSGKINVSQIPGVSSDGKLDLSKLPGDASGTIDISSIIGPNGEIDIQQLKQTVTEQLMQQLQSGGQTISVNQIPGASSNGTLDLSQLPGNLQGTIDISSIINQDGQVNVQSLNKLVLQYIMKNKAKGGNGLAMFLSQLPSGGTISISDIPDVSNGELDLSQLSGDLKGKINIQEIAGPGGQVNVTLLKRRIIQNVRAERKKQRGGSEGEKGGDGGHKGGLTYDQLCHRGFIEGLKDGAENGLIGEASQVQALLRKLLGKGGGLEKRLSKGVGKAFKDLTRATGTVISDADCGLGSIGEEAAAYLNRGQILEGVKAIVGRFLRGITKSIFHDALRGVGETANQILGGLLKGKDTPGNGGEGGGIGGPQGGGLLGGLLGGRR